MKLPDATCWNCQEPVGDEHFCVLCRKILPNRQGIDYFAFLGLLRKLKVDLTDLEKRFYALSRELHPDNFSRATEKERQLSLDKSAELNDAYRTLKDPLTRAEYLLKLEGQKVETSPRQAPPELLEEVFELNEWLAELKMGSPQEGEKGHGAETRQQLEESKARLEQRGEAFRKELQALFARWDAAVVSGSLDGERPALLDALGKMLAKRHFLRNLIREVSAALEGDGVQGVE